MPLPSAIGGPLVNDVPRDGQVAPERGQPDRRALTGPDAAGYSRGTFGTLLPRRSDGAGAQG